MAAMSVDPFCGPEDSASRAWVRGNLGLAWPDAAPGQLAQGSHVATTADRELWRADATGRFAAEILLHDAVFERVETDDGQAAAVRVSRAEQAVGEREGRAKAVEFAIHADPERLEDFGGGVNLGVSPGTPHSLLDRSG